MLILQWLLCTIWVCVITPTRSQLESNVNHFQILKYPTELTGYDFNKISLKLCNANVGGDVMDHDAAHAALKTYGAGGEVSDIGKVKTNGNTLENQTSAFLLKIFTNIVQQIRVQQSSCGKSKSSTRMSTTTAAAAATVAETEKGLAGSTIEPAAKTMATSKRSLRIDYEGQLPSVAQAKESFNILEQLKLDEKELQKLKLQSLQAQHDHSHNQQPTGLPQDIWDESSFVQLGKAGKRKRRKKKKKKKPTKDKDKKKKKKKKRKTKPLHSTALVGQPAHVLFASQATHFAHPQHVALTTTQLAMTTKKPQQHHFTPIKKIKYILRKNTIFKKKKKEYLNHLKQVLYPFVKFIAFFTVLNPFTLAVFLFSLVSPVVFGFIGFIGLSFLIKPFLALLFGVKRTVSSINRRKMLAKRRRERLRNSRRPITIHKHYYQQYRIPPPHNHQLRRPHHHLHENRQSHRQHQLRHAPRQPKHFNPLLPDVKDKLKKDTFLFVPNFVRYERITNGNQGGGIRI